MDVSKFRHWSRRGFNRSIYGSITMTIDGQLADLRRAGRKPSLIRLGPTASVIYAHEWWCERISDAPARHRGKVAIRYRDAKVSGVHVESEPS